MLRGFEQRNDEINELVRRYRRNSSLQSLNGRSVVLSFAPIEEENEGESGNASAESKSLELRLLDDEEKEEEDNSSMANSDCNHSDLSDPLPEDWSVPELALESVDVNQPDYGIEGNRPHRRSLTPIPIQFSLLVG